MKGKNQDIQDIIDFVTADDSNLSSLSHSDQSDQEPEAVMNSQDLENSDEEIDEDSREESKYNKPLNGLAGNPAAHIYHWQRQDTLHRACEFTDEFSPSPETPLIPQHLTKFLRNETLNDIVENTNLYSAQKRGKSVNSDSEEIKTLLGTQILIRIVQMLRYDAYSSQEIRYPLLADVMSLKQNEELRRFLHVVDNDALLDKDTDKLAKIRVMNEAIRNQCVQVEPEEYSSLDEQIITSKTKQSKMRKCNPKKPRKWGLGNLVRVGGFRFMYDF